MRSRRSAKTKVASKGNITCGKNGCLDATGISNGWLCKWALARPCWRTGIGSGYVSAVAETIEMNTSSRAAVAGPRSLAVARRFDPMRSAVVDERQSAVADNVHASQKRAGLASAVSTSSSYYRYRIAGTSSEPLRLAPWCTELQRLLATSLRAPCDLPRSILRKWSDAWTCTCIVRGALYRAALT